jgi:hypothetical protein
LKAKKKSAGHGPYTSIILAFRRVRKENHKFEAILGYINKFETSPVYIVKPYLKRKR